MKMTGNPISIAGGGSVIGRGPGGGLPNEGNTVVIAARRKQALDAATKGNPGTGVSRRTADITMRSSRD